MRLQAFIKKETLPQVFSSEFCEISKNTFFTEHLLATASSHTNYIQQHQQPVRRLKMKTLISRRANETTQTTMDTTLTTTFWILAERFIHTTYNLQLQQQVHTFKAKTLISLYVQMKQLKQPFFLIDHKNVFTWEGN